MTSGEWAAIKARLTPEQRERIGLKAQREGCSWLAVFRDWPGLFDIPMLTAPKPNERKDDG